MITVIMLFSLFLHRISPSGTGRERSLPSEAMHAYTPQPIGNKCYRRKSKRHTSRVYSTRICDSLAHARLPRNPNGFSVVFICFSRQELHARNNELDDDNIIVEIARPASVLAALKRVCILGKRP